MMNRNWYSNLGFGSLYLSTFLVVGFIAVILWDLIYKGAPSWNWTFFSEGPQEGMTKGGIFPVIVGTFYVTLISTIASLPLGIGTAIYLQEYAPDNLLTRLIRSSIRNLAGVPSVIFGLFGLVLFVQHMQMGTSLLASGLTLGLLTLPTVVASTEEALRNVPQSYREGALALGATQWEVIWHQVLPAASSGIWTGAMLAISRAAGETAPILFTGVTFYQRFLPQSLFHEFMAMPYHIFILSTQHHAIEIVTPIAYGTALLLLVQILILQMIAFYLRYKQTSTRR
jgi:phosphate transport system permease protein